MYINWNTQIGIFCGLVAVHAALRGSSAEGIIILATIGFANLVIAYGEVNMRCN